MKSLNGFKGKKQSGFTLIEIAIVLVIIGLLLGGVLQGQQLIENSRVKAAVNEFNGISAAAYSYQDRYGRLPGDDGGNTANLAGLTGRGGDWTTVTAAGGDDSTTANNGILEVAIADTFTGGEESTAFFQSLRAAGYIPGDQTAGVAGTNNNALPTNPFGGVTGLTNGTTVMGGMNGIKLCMSNVSGSVANALDVQLDDGDPASGTFRAAVGAGIATPSTTAETTYNEDNTYHICKRM